MANSGTISRSHSERVRKYASYWDKDEMWYWDEQGNADAADAKICQAEVVVIPGTPEGRPQLADVSGPSPVGSVKPTIQTRRALTKRRKCKQTAIRVITDMSQLEYCPPRLSRCANSPVVRALEGRPSSPAQSPWTWLKKRSPGKLGCSKASPSRHAAVPVATSHPQAYSSDKGSFTSLMSTASSSYQSGSSGPGTHEHRSGWWDHVTSPFVGSAKSCGRSASTTTGVSLPANPSPSHSPMEMLKMPLQRHEVTRGVSSVEVPRRPVPHPQTSDISIKPVTALICDATPVDTTYTGKWIQPHPQSVAINNNQHLTVSGPERQPSLKSNLRAEPPNRPRSRPLTLSYTDKPTIRADRCLPPSFAPTLQIQQHSDSTGPPTAAKAPTKINTHPFLLVPPSFTTSQQPASMEDVALTPTHAQNTDRFSSWSRVIPKRSRNGDVGLQGTQNTFQPPVNIFQPWEALEHKQKFVLTSNKLPKDKKRKKKRGCLVLGGLLTLLLVIIVVVLWLALRPRLGSSTPVPTTITGAPKPVTPTSAPDAQSIWLNLTDYPPLPTGVLTVAGPEKRSEINACVNVPTMWSCFLPKERADEAKPFDRDQPRLNLQIQFDNSSTREWERAAAAAAAAGSSLSAESERRLFEPSPAPPPNKELWFLGNTSDGIVAENKAGEPTPFYITVLSAPDKPIGPNVITTVKDVPKKRVESRRSSSNPRASLHPHRSIYRRYDVLSRDAVTPSSGSPAFPPPPLVDGSDHGSSGAGSPATLLPRPVQQPVRLYDRGLPTEHYGFYSYFDRVIYLRSTDVAPGSNHTADPDDVDGGSLQVGANAMIVFYETRFFVRLWTKKTPVGAQPAEGAKGPPALPIAMTFGTDTHGGNRLRKFALMYTIDRSSDDNSGKGTLGTVLANTPRVVLNDIGAGGSWINPRGAVGRDGGSDPALGGFDGGTGGCRCEWDNFRAR